MRRNAWCILVALFVLGGLWLNDAKAQTGGYYYRRQVTIDHTKVSGSQNLTDFPVLLRLTSEELRTRANGGHVEQGDGYDIVLTLGDGVTMVDHEIESYNPVTGELLLWARMPAISATVDTPLFLYYGNSAVTASQENAPGVWTNEYQMVQHFEEGSGVYGDSTAQEKNATAVGTAPSSATGKIGQAIRLPDANAHLDVSGDQYFSSVPKEFTVELWVSSEGEITEDRIALYNGFQGEFNIVWGKATKNIAVGIHQTKDSKGHYNGQWYYAVTQQAYNGGEWVHLVGTYKEGETLKLYRDGVLQNTVTVGAGEELSNPPTYHAAAIGAYCCNPYWEGTRTSFWKGLLDEVRVAIVARSAGWIATSYENQRAPSSFVTVGGEETLQEPELPQEPEIFVTVCVSGCNHTTIQGAIDAIPAQLSDRYIVEIRDSRTYDESVRISGKQTTALNTITLLAKTGETPTILAPDRGKALVLNQNYVTVDGLHFSGDFRDKTSGIEIEGGSNNTVRNSHFSRFNRGTLILVHEGRDNRIQGNLFEKSVSANGVALMYYSGGNTVQGNTFVNTRNAVIVGDHTRGETIRENTFFLDGSLNRAIVSQNDLTQTQLSTMDANRYYLNRGSSLGAVLGTTYATLGAWQDATGFDTSAEEIFVPQDPRFSPWAEITKTVCASGCHFQTIQGALAAMPNLIVENRAYRVEVQDEGPYNGEIRVAGLTDVDRTITITAGPNVRPVIRQGEYAKGFYLRYVDYVTVSGFRFPGGHETNLLGGPIFVEGSNNTIEDNVIGGDLWTDAPAIVLHGGARNRVLNNRIRNVSRGVSMYYYSSGHTIQNNTIAETFSAVALDSRTSNIRIENNTFFQNTRGVDVGSNRVQCFDEQEQPVSCNYTLRNNSIVADGSTTAVIVTASAVSQSFFTSDYQNFFLKNGARFAQIENTVYATLADWQAQGQDAHSVLGDPLFVDAEGPDYDFHVKSRGGRFTPQGFVIDTAHSPAIDAGDPATSIGAEQIPHGGRINIGAYGGMQEASKSFTPPPPDPLGVPEPIAPINDAFVNGGNLTWRVVQRATRYDLEIGTTQATVATFSDIVRLSQEIPSTLSDGQYVWRVRADDGTTTSAWSPLSSFTLDRTLPENVALNQPEQGATLRTSPIFSWAPVANAFQYEFQLARNAQFTTPIIVRSDLTQAQFTPPFSLQDGASFWRVRARDRAGNVSVAWTERSFTLAPSIQPPTLAPSLLSPLPRGTLPISPPVNFRWDAAPFSVSSTLQISAGETFITILFEKNDISQQQLLWRGTVPDGPYFWRVRGVNDGGHGPWSDVGRFVLDTTPPLSPVFDSPESSASLIGPVRPVFHWENRSDDVVTTVIWVSTDRTFPTPSVKTREGRALVPDTSFQFPELFSEGTYFWRAYSFDGTSNQSSSTAVATFTVVSPPSRVVDPPSLLSPQDGTTVTAAPTLRWGNVARALSYDLEAATDDTFAAEKIVVGQTVSAPTTEFALPLSLLFEKPFSRLHWRVRVATEEGQSTFSPSRSLLLDRIPPAAPLLLEPNDQAVLAARPTFSWRASPEADGASYRLVLRKEVSPGLPPILVSETTLDGRATTSSSPALPGNGIYTWGVRAVDVLGNRSAEAVRTFSFFQPVDAPELLSPDPNALIESEAVTFRWTDVGASSSVLEIAKAQTFATPVVRSTGQSTERAITTLTDGIYYWRAYGVTQSIPGSFSAVRSFTVDRTVRRDIDLRRVLVTHYPERVQTRVRPSECRESGEYTCSDDDLFRVQKSGDRAPILHVPRQDALAHELRTRGLRYTTTQQNVTVTRLILGRIGRVYDLSSVETGAQVVVTHDVRTAERVLREGHTLALAHRDPLTGVWDFVGGAVYNRQKASFTAPAEEGSYAVVIYVEKRGQLNLPVPLRNLGVGR